jgi:AraC-like DNA-binding protein
VKLYLKYDVPTVCKKVLEEQLDKLNLSYNVLNSAEAEITENVPATTLNQLHAMLNAYGIEVVENQKSILVQKIKDVIIEMVYLDEELPESKISAYLAKKLKHSYGYLANIFSDVTYTSIENFIILQKIERAKELILTNNLSFSEIAWKLNYSSSAHFSTQFKKTTGLTPSAFLRIIKRRRNVGQDT